jgi:hypothetical protein
MGKRNRLSPGADGRGGGLFTVLAARAAVSWLLAAWLRRCLRGRCGAAWPGSCDLTGDENGKQLGNHLFRFHFSYLF